MIKSKTQTDTENSCDFFRYKSLLVLNGKIKFLS